MSFYLKLKPAIAILSLTFGQLVFAQSDAKAVAQQPGQIDTDQETKSAPKARIVIEWATIFDGLGFSNTEISVDKVLVCKVNADSKICDVLAEPGQRELKLNTNLDFGTFSEQ